MYSGERSTLHNFLKLFQAWAFSQESEEALTLSPPVVMTGKKSRRELEQKTRKTVGEKVAVCMEWSN